MDPKKIWAAQIPLWLLVLGTLPVGEYLETYYPGGLVVYRWLMSHPLTLAAAGLFISPGIAIASSLVFARQNRP